MQPGIAAGVSYQDKTIWFKGFGVKSKTGSAMAPDSDTIFRIGSVSKVFAVRCLTHCCMQHLISSFYHFLTFLRISRGYIGGKEYYTACIYCAISMGAGLMSCSRLLYITLTHHVLTASSCISCHCYLHMRTNQCAFMPPPLADTQGVPAL